MAQPNTTSWSDGLHALAEAAERVWLDQWARGHINPTTLQPEPAAQTEPVLALAGSTR
ncbi:hypothetical protein [Streptomyces sp. NPDC004783]|uniref:hypothetical protein n=1 Tax=Streptomyces sp. NPDC004783 TaxID=3154459 RepID=UPI0033B3F071